MHKNWLKYTVLLLMLASQTAHSQDYRREQFRVVCYNVENYFDTVKDSIANDSEFLPQGERHWDISRYKTKQMRIGKVLAAIGGWNAPPIVGLCEVESDRALRDLVRYSGLKAFGYQFIHYDSPDARGVDVALLYHPLQFSVIYSKPIRIRWADQPEFKTRDVLLVTGKVSSGDTLHIFVCHLPSRLGGELESEERRLYVAQTIKNQVDSLFAVFPKPNIIIMGDFNDYPDNKSIAQVLQAAHPEKNPHPHALYNLSLPLHLAGEGTYRHDGQWGMLDQFIVSGNLLDSQSNFFTQQTDIQVFNAEFLLEPDEANLGKKPFRTYVGMKYNNGFSDHLPLYVDFWLNPSTHK